MEHRLPALVALFTWLTLTHKDVFLQKSRALIRLKDKIPQKRRTISMLVLTTILSFGVMAYKPNEMTQLKEQIAVLASLYVGWLWQANSLHRRRVKQRVPVAFPTRPLC